MGSLGLRVVHSILQYQDHDMQRLELLGISKRFHLVILIILTTQVADINSNWSGPEISSTLPLAYLIIIGQLAV